ncbi:MetQ/NlpA family ABC transporter substrate-binding protein [Lactobacillaceae bacterium Scapto_B20]
MKKIIKRFSIINLLIISIFILSGCGRKMTIVKIGIIDTDVKLWQPTVEKLKHEGIELVLTQFNSYGQPNGSLFHQEIDMNAFQTKAFLKNWNHENHGNLVAIGETYVEPMRIYSQKINSLKQLKAGDSIALPNDDTNKARALKLLQSAGVLKLNHAKVPAVSDVTKNRHKFQFFTVDVSVTIRDMSDSTIAVVNNNFAREAHLKPKDALATEQINHIPDEYMNVIAVNKQKRHNKAFQKVVKAFQSTQNQRYLKQISNQTIQPK